jgi:hypothetical protein
MNYYWRSEEVKEVEKCGASRRNTPPLLGVASRYVGTKSKAPALQERQRNERNKIHDLQAGFTSEDACF